MVSSARASTHHDMLVHNLPLPTNAPYDVSVKRAPWFANVGEPRIMANAHPNRHATIRFACITIDFARCACANHSSDLSSVIWTYARTPCSTLGRTAPECDKSCNQASEPTSDGYHLTRIRWTIFHLFRKRCRLLLGF